jgi:hypothetical protein
MFFIASPTPDAFRAYRDWVALACCVVANGGGPSSSMFSDWSVRTLARAAIADAPPDR